MADTPTTPGFNPNTASIADILSGFKRTAVNDPGGAHLVGGDEFGEFARSRWMPLAENLAPGDFNAQSTPADLPTVPGVSERAIAGVQNATRRFTQPFDQGGEGGGGGSLWDAYSSMFEGQGEPTLNADGRPVGTGPAHTGKSFGESLGDFLNFGFDKLTGVNVQDGTFTPSNLLPFGGLLDIANPELTPTFNLWDSNEFDGGTLDSILSMSDADFDAWTATQLEDLSTPEEGLGTPAPPATSFPDVPANTGFDDTGGGDNTGGLGSDFSDTGVGTNT